MTFIELVRAVRSRVGMQGTGPSSITGAAGAEVDLVNVVSDAWLDIQNSRDDWRWMRSQATFNVAVGTEVYTPFTIFATSSHRLGRWREDTFYWTDTDSKKKPANYLDYDNWTYRHLNDTAADNNKISEWTIRPYDEAIVVNRPSSTYSVRIDYQKKPQTLVTDSDTPEMPSHFHLVIVYEAVSKYCAAISTPEIYDKYSYDHAKLYGALQRAYLPEKKIRVTGIA